MQDTVCLPAQLCRRSDARRISSKPSDACAMRNHLVVGQTRVSEIVRGAMLQAAVSNRTYHAQPYINQKKDIEQIVYCFVVSNTPRKGIRKWVSTTENLPANDHLHASTRPPVLSARPSGLDVAGGKRWALVGLAAVDGVPGAGEDDASDEDDGSVVHAVYGDGKSGRHGEEGDGKADPS